MDKQVIEGIVTRSRRLMNQAGQTSIDGNDKQPSQRGSQGSKSHKTRSTFSKTSSTRRKMLEAQVKADEEIARLLAQEQEMKLRVLEHEKQRILNKLALDEARFEEDSDGDTNLYPEEGQIEVLPVGQSSQISQKGKVENWLNDQSNMHPQNGDGCKKKLDFSINDNSFDIKQLLSRQNIDKDLPLFVGDIKEWPHFYMQFTSTTQLLGLSDEENICRLRKCLKGNARRAVEGLLITTSSVSEIMRILKSRFGRSDLVIRTLINDANNLPVVKQNDFSSLTHFADVVSNLVATIETMNMHTYLSCPQLLTELLQKLPYNLQLSWGGKVTGSEKEFSLKDFKNWIWEKSEGANYAQMVISKGSNNIGFSQRERNKTSLVTTKSKSKDINIICIFCKGKHEVYACEKFKKLSPDEKWSFVKKNGVCFACIKSSHRIFSCTRRRKCELNGCQKFHHPLLHNEEFRQGLVEEGNASPGNSTPTTSEQLVAHTQKVFGKKVLLRIAPLTLKSGDKEVKLYALFDEASTVTLLDENVASELNLVGKNTDLCLKWADKNTINNTRSKLVSFDVRGQDDVTYSLKNVYTLKDMDLPVQSVNAHNLKIRWKHLQGVDFESMCNAQPKLLIGQDNWDLITSREVIEGPKNSPALSKTKLGWILHGNLQQFQGRVDDNIVLHVKHSACEENDDLHNQVKHFFTTESFGVKIPEKKLLSKENERAEKMMQQITKRVGNRWETGLLWRENITTIPDSRAVALQRYGYIERRMKCDKGFEEAYRNKIEEYVHKGYAKKLSDEEAEEIPWNTWYLPHFGVVNENKPGKLRLVFDAAAKSQGKSLNDMLMTGPDLYNSLIGILWKFRQHKIAFSADIREMFHQVKIRSEDQPAQRFYWKEDVKQEKLSTYAMQVMMFGAVSSPYSAQYVKNRNAEDFQVDYPKAVAAILHKHYMDDYLESVETEEEAIELANDVMMIHKAGGFELRSWVSNSSNLLETIPCELRNIDKLVDNKDIFSTQRILGMKWNPLEDILTFSMNFHKVNKDILTGMKTPTKRDILKVVMSLFDPLGLLGHFVVKGKIILQKLWKTGINWDDEITVGIENIWKSWIERLQEVGNLKIPRAYSIGKNMTVQLHVFCDASEQAFASVSYFRVEKKNHVEVSLIMSRTQVAPMKEMSIPRLELQAAVMASRLAEKIKEEHTLKIDRTYFWTDSRTVLCWIRSKERNFKTFVAHRVGEIHERSNVEDWNWVPTKLNVADDATRYEKETDLNPNGRWYMGPGFLYDECHKWPKEENKLKEIEENILELKPQSVLVHHEDYGYLPDIRRFSKWMYLVRSTAYVLKFINLSRKKLLETKELTRKNIKEAELIWIGKAQADSFGEEINFLSRGKDIPKNSRLLQLSPGLDEDQILRLYGRTDKSSVLHEDTCRPIILEGRHPYTRLLIYHYHCNFQHSGTEFVLNQMRQKYWIIQGRKAVHTVSQRCMQCKLRRAKPRIPEMGQLPEFRLIRPPRPFSYVGLDYFGPYEVTIGRRREKRYGVLFTCLSIRAVHIELADSLTTDSAILAIRRFFARRGQPLMMISDNGSNLRGASKELKNCLENLDENLIKERLVNYETEWKFIPPGSPHMGGAWERMVRSIKKSLKITLKERSPRPEVLYTLLCEAEHLVNSRPLTYISSDSRDEESLTPNHFLIGSHSNIRGMGLSEIRTADLKKQWKIAEDLSEKFWNRWITEYLPTLTKRTKWFEKTKSALQVNDVVIIFDNRLPRNNWPLGKIVATYPGKDGLIRVVDVKTQFGTYRRPTSKICKLDLLESNEDL